MNSATFGTRFSTISAARLAVVAPILTSFLIACGGGGVVPGPTPPTSSLASQYKTVVWQDDFTGTTLDGTKWAGLTGNGAEYGNPGWGNNEFEYYLPSSATVSGTGNLQIHAKWDTSTGNAWSGKITSARLTSLNGVDLSQPGFLEVRADLPCTTGSWPAIWLLPGVSPGQTFPPVANTNPSWPVGGEIDIMEWIGRYFAGQTALTQSTLHLPKSGASGPVDTYQYVKSTLASPVCGNFHLYQLAWTASQIQFAIDDNVISTCTKSNLTCTPVDPNSPAPDPAASWPYDAQKTYYVLLNLAVGGNLGAPNGDNSQIPLNYDQTMLVDYVHYLRP